MQVDFFPHRLQWARLGFSDDLGVKIGHHDDDDCGLGMVVRIFKVPYYAVYQMVTVVMKKKEQ